jgi:hypothetical protein
MGPTAGLNTVLYSCQESNSVSESSASTMSYLGEWSGMSDFVFGFLLFHRCSTVPCVIQRVSPSETFGSSKTAGTERNIHISEAAGVPLGCWSLSFLIQCLYVTINLPLCLIKRHVVKTLQGEGLRDHCVVGIATG